MTGSLRHIMQLAFHSPLLPVLLVFGSFFIGMKFESTLLMDSGREGLPAEMISLKSSSKVVQQDDRVGQLWIKESEEAMKKRCTVNHLRNGFWITARPVSKDSMVRMLRDSLGNMTVKVRRWKTCILREKQKMLH